MKTVIIDNYDSFTYNLAHLVRELGAEVDVLRNDKFRLEELEPYDKIILSPGPGVPEEAGLLLEVIRTYAGRKPMLGVCLGEQAIGQVFGGKLVNLRDVFHGVQTEIRIKDEGLGMKDERLRDEKLKMRNEELGVNDEEFEMRDKELRIRNEELRIRSEEAERKDGKLGMKNEASRIRYEEAGMKDEKLGMRNEEAGMKDEELRIRSERLRMNDEELRMRGEGFGVKEEKAGKEILLEEDYIFRGLPAEIPVGRYHSWVVDTKDFPNELAITAISPEGQIMALKHREYDIHGIQFHPESVLTPDGKTIVKNWLFK